MSAKRIAAIVFVMSAAVLISFFVIKGAGPASNSNISASLAPNDESGQNPQNLLAQNPIKWVENLVKGNFSEPTSNESQQNIQTTDINSVNLTDLVGQSMFSQMQSLDQSGQNPFANFDPNSSNSQKILQQAINSVSNSDSDGLFTPAISDKDLKISSDNSKQAKVNYLNLLTAGGNQYLNDPTFDRTAEQIETDISQDCLGGGSTTDSKIASAYKGVAENYLNINVPSDWLDFHKQLINYFKRGYLIFDALSNCLQDPIKGYLAAQAMLQFASETPAIQESMQQKATEASLLP